MLLSAARDLPDPGALAFFRDPDEMMLKPDSKACPFWMARPLSIYRNRSVISFAVG